MYIIICVEMMIHDFKCNTSNNCTLMVCLKKDAQSRNDNKPQGLSYMILFSLFAMINKYIYICVSDEILDLYSLLVISDFMIFNHNVYNIVVSLSISHVYG